MQTTVPHDPDGWYDALAVTNAEIKVLQEKVASLDGKLQQLLSSAASPAKAAAHQPATAFDALAGPVVPKSRSHAALDRLNELSTTDDQQVGMASTRIVMHQIVLPSDSDTLGICFGGQVLGWIDICAGLAAKTVARGPVVTASVDAVHFLKPCRVVSFSAAEGFLAATATPARLSQMQGSVAIVASMVNRTFKSSLEVSHQPKSQTHLVLRSTSWLQ